jgi:TetR/AcrR family transcriptional regulator, fatty acid metabolism regulator protein
MAKKEIISEMLGGKSNQLFAEIGRYFSADGSFSEDEFRRSLRASLTSIKEQSRGNTSFSSHADAWLSTRLKEIIDYLYEKGMPEASIRLFRAAVEECAQIGLSTISLPTDRLREILTYVPYRKLGKDKDDTPDKKKARIMDAALRVFARDGYHRATVDAIAELAGVGKGSVYRYFKSKEDLLKSLLMESSAEILDFVNHILSMEMDLAEQIQVVIQAWVEFIANNPELYCLIQSNIQLPDTNTRDVFFNHLFTKLPLLKERVISLNRDNRIRISNLTFDTIFLGSYGFVDWVFYKWLRYGKTYDLRDEVPIITDMLLYGCIGSSRKAYAPRKEKK